ncbi:MAG: type I methionyl aminopeptidase [Spirochaetia bacterium]
MKPGARLKTAVEVSRIRIAGRIIGRIFKELSGIIAVGMTTRDIEVFCKNLIGENGAESALKGFDGYPGHVCVSVNQVMAHGIPNDYTVGEGDLVKVDIAVKKGGWFADGAWTFLVGRGTEEGHRLRNSSWAASMAGIEAACGGARVGDIGEAVEKAVTERGCYIIPHFAGHGIGFQLHEEPPIYPVGKSGYGHPVVPGMVFTVEPLVTLRPEEVKFLHDGWTAVAANGSPSAQFEHTVSVNSRGTEILTACPEDLPYGREIPPF